MLRTPKTIIHVYGLEILPLNNSHIDKLNKFHLKNLKSFQPLPIRTASCVVLLLIGELPLEAEIHKRQLIITFLHNILSCENSNIRDISERQILMNMPNPTSFFNKIKSFLSSYQLPEITKLSWKTTVKTSIREFWAQKLKPDVSQKSSLKHVSQNCLTFGSTLPSWSCLNSTNSDIRIGSVKVRLITGTFFLQSLKYKYSEEAPTCKSSGLTDEGEIHFLLDCPALFKQRKECLPRSEEISNKHNWTKNLEKYFPN